MPEKKRAKLLIVDDETAARYGMRKVFKSEGYEIAEALDGIEALEKIQSFRPDVVLCDINMPKMSGMEFLKTLKARQRTDSREPLVIMITAYGSEKIAVQAMKAGAYDYLSKPYDIDDLRLTVKKALDKLELEHENIQLKEKLETLSRVNIVGESDAIGRVLNLVEKVAPTDVTVLLTGESGTGKELVAQTIHARSVRSKGPFVTMNCAAIPKDLVESELFGHEKGAFTGASSRREGKFEIADGGTLFLDEIADMSLDTQAKILRVLEDKSFHRLGGKDLIRTDVRLISATNKNLQEEIKQGRFREDLYYRIKVVEIHLPALVERKEDIPLLVQYFIKKFASKHSKTVMGIQSDALRLLRDYAWPGNVRQLMNVIEQCVVLADSDMIGIEHLPPEISQEMPDVDFKTTLGSVSFTEMKNQAMRKFEYEMIAKALNTTGGNISQAARLLQMKRQFLQQKINSLGIDVKVYKQQWI